MNKHCYRLIFSRTHGELRVVSELARSYSTEPGQSRGSGGIRLWVTVRRAVWLLGLALFAGPVLADGIVADVTAAPGQRPEVIATQNGLPQVNITAPNQAGISHNQYQQFDVDAKGAILNNSAVITATQMAGMIQSNPNLNPNAAPARVILNEVNSNDPSQLRGFLEVAGGQAQVIVANPAGIVCNGCGTLNAGRMTLTTGKPQLNADGSLAGYQVERGVVRVEGGGLNGDTRHDTEYVDILARAVDINAGVWAKAGLSVVAGRNRIGADGTTATPLADDGSTKPELAIDMGQMGGMYSGQIRMIGTEAGVGVRNQGGHLQAGKTLTISSEGKLSWQSAAQEAVTVAGGDIRLTARNAIDHHGKLHSGGTLAATGDVRLSANSGIESHGHNLAGSDANSQIVCDADLRLDSQGDIRASGSLLGKKDVTLVGHRVDISGVQLAANHATLVAREDGVALRQSQVDSGQFTLNTVGDVDAQQAQVKAGRWEVNTHHLHNQKAVWTQTGGGESHFTLTGKLDNTDGSIEAHSLALTSGALTNQHGRLVALNDSAQYWRVSGILDNNSGELGSNGDLQLDTGRLDNQGGTVKTQAALTLYASGDINNTQGKVLAGNALRLDALGAFDNQHGQVNGAQLLLTAQRLNNAQGQVASQGDVTLTTRQGLNNQRGLIGAGKALTIHIGDDGDNGAGSAQSETPLMATAQNIDNGATRSRSGQALTSNAAGAIDNRAGEISGESLVLTAQQINNTQGKVIAQRDANLTAQQALSNANGLLEAGGTLSMRTDGDWDNRDGTAQGGHQVTVATHTLNNASGRLQSGGDLTLDSTGDISNQRGKLTAQHTLDIKGATTGLFDNDGGSLQSGGPLSLHGGRLTNRQSGRVLSQQALSLILADDWDNQDGQLTSSGRTLVRAAGLHNAQGAINALGNLDMQFTGKLDNAHGHLFSQSTQTLQAQEIDNQLGWMGSQGDWFATSEHFDNTGGSVQGQQGVQLAATWLHNAKGVLQSAARLALRVAQDIDNQKGKIAAQGPLAVQGTTPDATTGRINNAGGKWLAGEALNIAAISLNNTQGGLLYSQKHLYLNLKEQLDNRQGRLQGGEALKLDAQTLNNASGTIDGQQRLALRILGGLDNAGGAVRSNGDQQITAASIDNRQGVFSSRGGLTLTAARLDNTNGTLISQGTGIYRIEMLDNRQGKVHSGEALTLDGRQVNNQRGQLVSS